MISELKDVKCSHCGKIGFTGRKDIKEKYLITETNRLKEQTCWSCVCKYCGETNEIIWEET